MTDLSVMREHGSRGDPRAPAALRGEAARRASDQLAAARVTKDRGLARDKEAAADCGALFWAWAAPEGRADR